LPKQFVLQGLKFTPILLNTSDYTVARNYTANGDIDTASTYGPIILDGYDDYLYSIPFGLEKYAMLMKRQDVGVAINFAGLMAGINSSVYILLFASMLCLIALSYLNEARTHNDNSHNGLWTIVRILMPIDTEPLQNMAE
jgi:hypothetical protein